MEKSEIGLIKIKFYHKFEFDLNQMTVLALKNRI